MDRDHPSMFAPQDWLIIAEALVNWSGNPGTPSTPREERAWELVEAIAADQGLELDELMRQVDESWRGPDRRK